MPSRRFAAGDVHQVKGNTVDVTNQAQNTPLYSELARDETMRDLLESFVAQLPSRAAAMTVACRSGDMKQLKLLAHQLKGAAGSYGFLPISEACRQLESTVDGDEISEALRSAMTTVVVLCQRATHLPKS